MIKVKTLKPGSTGIAGHWYMGPDHMARVSRKTALALCGMYPAPTLGYETTIAFKRDPMGFTSRLAIQNVSGDYWIASSSVKMSDWPSMFSVECVE